MAKSTATGRHYPQVNVHLSADRAEAVERLSASANISMSKAFQALLWHEGHRSCGHSCQTYAGLGEPCQNPYLPVKKERAS